MVFSGPLLESSPLKTEMKWEKLKPLLVLKTSYVSVKKKADVLQLLTLVKVSAEGKKMYDSLLKYTKKNVKDDFQIIDVIKGT